jgi:hypothetical protein
MQVRTPVHTSRQSELKECFEGNERDFPEGVKRFFKLFEESTFERSQATAQSMTKFAKRQTKTVKQHMFFHSLQFLVRSSRSEMLSWPNSPLLVMLQFVDPNELLIGDLVPRFTPLHHLADLADPSEYSTHVNQLILSKQLVEHGANVNAVSLPKDETPLHRACVSGNVTNLDFVEYLLAKGADPNAQDHLGRTPLVFTTRFAPGAAKFLLQWPTTNFNIIPRSGESFLARVRSAISALSVAVASRDSPEQVHRQFVLQQWREIEEMLVERGAADSSITILE